MKMNYMYNNPNNEELSQYEKIFVIMLKSTKDSGNVSWWRASNFQQDHYGIFVGYEASARMSEMLKKYPFAFEVRQNGRFREMRFKIENAREIYYQLPNDLARHLVREKIIQ